MRPGGRLKRTRTNSIGTIGNDPMTKLMNQLDALDKLREAISEAWDELAQLQSPEGDLAGATEQKKRASVIADIREILEGRPLESFSARHLVLLATLFSYWRDLEVEGEIQAPPPDPMH